MVKKFYLDTSIWLDLFENRGRNGEIAKTLIRKIINNGDRIILSEAIKNELLDYGFSKYEISEKFEPFRKII